ncbi:hypothetical protein WA588_003004 [Blastocystis sp. NMH]
MNSDSPTGRDIAESILQAAEQQHVQATEYHDANDPYYWEPEFPDEDVDKLNLFTIVGHNLHYAFMTVHNACANVGYSILGALGWLESDYEWINREIRREKRLEAIIEEEEREEQMLRESRARATNSRRLNATENGSMQK